MIINLRHLFGAPWRQRIPALTVVIAGMACLLAMLRLPRDVQYSFGLSATLGAFGLAGRYLIPRFESQKPIPEPQKPIPNDELSKPPSGEPSEPAPIRAGVRTD